MVPQELDDEVIELRASGYHIELQQEGQRVYVLFKDVDIGPRYLPPRSDLLMFTSVEYPNAGFDMFWVGSEVRLATGGTPQGGDQIETHLGRPWRRFSWHLNRPWNPARDTLRSWLSHVEERLNKGV